MGSCLSTQPTPGAPAGGAQSGREAAAAITRVTPTQRAARRRRAIEAAGVGSATPSSNGRVDFGHATRWRAEREMTLAELMRQRNEFWDTAAVYEGRSEIWQALRLACESDDAQLAAAILESVGVSVPTGRIADGAYDELGACYDIPLYCLCAPVNLVAEPGDAAADGSYARRVQEDGPALLRESVDSTRSIVADHATAAPCAIVHGLAPGLSPSLYAVGSAKFAAVSVQSPTSVADSDAVSFASSSVPLHLNSDTVEIPLRPLRIRLCVGKDVQVNVAADSTIAQIEQLLRDADHITLTTNRVLFFYLGHLLAPSAAPLRDLHLPKAAIIQVFYSLS
ncbi:hypothetical protein IW152_004707 [Coemansia sp. BCRC 34962]|nr:hypothetical protein IW152_004707 [Coemansia sp. BCRC 34962]